MRSVKTTVSILLASFLAVACQPGSNKAGKATAAPKLGSGQGDDKVIAVIDDQVITVGDFKARMNRQSPYIRARYNTPRKKKEFLENMIRFELQAREARRRGLDKDPDVIRTMKQVMIQKLTRQVFEDKLKPEDITDEEIESYYKEHEKDYNKPEMVRARHIFFEVKDFKDKKAVAAAKKKAMEVLMQLKKRKKEPEAFVELARKYSEDRLTKNRGGDLGYFAAPGQGGTVDKAVAEAAFKLAKVNDISGIVKGAKGFHIIQLTSRRKAIHRTLDQVRATIRSTLYRKRRKELFKQFLEDLKSKAKIQIDEEALSSIEIEGVNTPPHMARPVKPVPTPAKNATKSSGIQKKAEGVKKVQTKPVKSGAKPAINVRPVGTKTPVKVNIGTKPVQQKGK